MSLLVWVAWGGSPAGSLAARSWTLSDAAGQKREGLADAARLHLSANPGMKRRKLHRR